MASIILSTVGNMILPGIGGIVGSYVGSAIDRAIFSPKIKSYGPRLSDLTVQTSTEGATLPILFGTMRFAGNVIWSTGLTENATEEEQGGMSGGGSSYTTYSYTTDAAVAICEGVITGIRRIWADSKLIYDVSETASVDTLVSSSSIAKSIRIYTGTEDQLEDPLIQAVEGSVPAYRGTAYIVVEDLNLADFGNRLPNFTFEVVKGGTFNGSLANTTLYNDIASRLLYNRNATYVDNSGVYIWTWISTSIITIDLIRLNGSIIRYKTINIGTPEMSGPWWLTGGQSYICRGYSDINATAIPIIDGTNYGIGIIKEDGSYTKIFSNSNSSIGSAYAYVIKNGYIYFTCGYGLTTKLYRCNINGTNLIQITIPGTLASITWIGTSTKYIYILVSVSNNARIDYFDIDTLNYIASFSTTNSYLIANFATVLDNDYIIYTETGSNIVSHNFMTGIKNTIVPTQPYNLNAGADFYHYIFLLSSNNILNYWYNNYSIAVGLKTFKLNLLSKGTQTLQQVCEEITAKSGLSSTKYDYSSLSAININGYIIGRVSTIRSTLEPLMSSYSFELLEEDNKIVAKKLSNNSIQQALVKDNLGSEQI